MDASVRKQAICGSPSAQGKSKKGKQGKYLGLCRAGFYVKSAIQELYLTIKFKKTAFLFLCTAAFFIQGCAYYPDKEGDYMPMVLGDAAKCVIGENHHLPTCYCNEFALLKHPDRRTFCASSFKPEGNLNAVSAVQVSAEHHTLDMDAARFNKVLEKTHTNTLGICPQIITQKTPKLDTFQACELEPNQHHPACYCHESVTNQYPERAGFCSVTGEGWLVDELSGKTSFRNLQWAEDFRKVTSVLETSVKEEVEFWENHIQSYIEGNTIEDDCDSADNLLDLAFVLGGFEMQELAKILVDTNLSDDRPADHMVVGIWIGDTWRYFEQGSSNVLPLELLEYGNYLNTDGLIVAPAKIVGYRKLSQSRWHKGFPAKPEQTNIEYCPTGKLSAYQASKVPAT